ncbi:SDR family oxidoreductase [Jatrophihabitans sp.]|uniref:SDR family NAD(P)-dependent oxidoreductase n=1 Tax=Jatrophihabitans sp. TaxID=1932789 RepID=UPI0030C6CF19|nr:3-oxoacyl-[acyl-carrier-protein] reductase [Jatrophihabitans sp.]
MGTQSGRVALVSGGGRGIGAAISRRLAADGATVAVNYRRDEAAAKATVAAIIADGGHAVAYQASIDDPDQTAVMTAQVQADLGTVDILVCNAGIASRGNSLVDTDPAEFERLMRTHVYGAATLCRLLVPAMRTADRGDVVVISSTATRGPLSHSGPYTMAKVALEAYAQTLAVEEVANGLHVNIVAPGLVTTEMGDRLVRAAAGLSQAADLDERSPYSHVCRPEEVADVVAYLVSDQASFLNGQRIYVDGGGSRF